MLFFFPLLRGETFSDVAGREQRVYPWAGALAYTEKFPVLHYDQDDSLYPWQVFMSHELRSGHLPLWNPYSFAGAPFFANGQSGVLYPPRLALAYTVSPPRVHDLLLVTHFFLAGLAMFVLLGYLGLSFPAALVGGLAWMLNSFALAWQALEHYVVIEAGLPLGVLLAHMVVKRRSWGAACALGVLLAFFFVGGNVLFAELAALTVLGYGAAVGIGDALSDRRALLGSTGRLAAAAMLCGGLAAVAILPTIALAGESARISLTYDELSKFALSWGDLQYIFRWPKDPYKYDPYHWGLFAGSAVGVLALIGLVRRSFLARFAAVLGILTLLFMLHTPITHVVSAALPGFGNFKPLSRAAFLLQFALAILAAFGLQTLLERIAHSRRPRLGADSPARVVLIVAVALSIVVQEWLWKRDVMPHQPAGAQYLYPATHMIGELETERVSRFLPTFPTFRGSTPLIYGLQSVGGYESLLPARTQDFWRVLGDRLSLKELASEPLISAYHPGYDLARVQPSLLARASVSHLVAGPPEVVSTPVPPRLELEHGGSDGRIFTVDGALPPAYVVGGCEQFNSPLAALERFISDDFDPSGKVILERSSMQRAGLTCTGSQSGRAGTASVVARSTNGLSVFARARRPAWLVVAESWDPGWKVTVDDRPAELLPADSALRAVRLSSGEHFVRFKYEPERFTLGVMLSSVSLGIALGGIGLALWRRLRPARRPYATGTRPSKKAGGRAAG